MRYPYDVHTRKVENHVFFEASSLILDGCVGQGETAEEAVRDLELNENEWLDAARKYGIPIPDEPT